MCSFATNTEVINTDYIMNEKLVTTSWEDLPWSLASGGSLPRSAWVICKRDSTKRYAYPPSFFFLFFFFLFNPNGWKSLGTGISLEVVVEFYLNYT